MVTQIMGILNVTPDSFSDGGRFVDIDVAVEYARQMRDDGASIIDIGGESTRPGAEPVSLDEELSRVIPVVGRVSELGIAVSVDTRHEEVARAAVEAGASMINDVSASLWPVAADTGAAWIAMHMKGEPQQMQKAPHYKNVCAEVLEFLTDRAARAANGGVDEVWIDPGFGFGKTHQHNVDLVAGIDRFVASGFNVVLGVSRKATLGELSARSDARVKLDFSQSVEPTAPNDRIEFGIAFATWAMAAGVEMIRCHDVAPLVEAANYVNQQYGNQLGTDQRPPEAMPASAGR